MIGLLVAASRFVSILPSTTPEKKVPSATRPSMPLEKPFRTG